MAYPAPGALDRDLAERAETLLVGPEQQAWQRRFDQDLANVRAALGRWREQDVETGLQLITALWPYWLLRGYLDEASEWLAALLERAGPAIPGTTRAKALWMAAFVANGRDEYRDRYLRESECLNREVGDENGLARVWEQDAWGAWTGESPDFERAVALYPEVLRIARATGDSWLLGQTLRNYGLLVRQQGALDRSRPLLEESLAIYRRMGNAWGIAMGLRHLGTQEALEGDTTRARQLWAEGLAVSRAIGEPAGIEICGRWLARDAISRGDIAAADAHTREANKAVAGDQTAVDRWMVLQGEIQLARVHADFDRARRLAESAVEAAQGLERFTPTLIRGVADP